MPDKPPLGVMPRWRWLELRGQELSRAINEHFATPPSERVDYRLCSDWCMELQRVIDELPNAYAQRSGLGEMAKK